MSELGPKWPMCDELVQNMCVEFEYPTTIRATRRAEEGRPATGGDRQPARGVLSTGPVPSDLPKVLAKGKRPTKLG